ncbi:MAG: SAM-dependent chlorinase/fluorinase [Actinomycetota bacterium]
MARRYDTISVLTDYGTDDEFAGVLRAVVRDLAPHATVIDLTHGIAPYDVRGGSLALARSIAYVPVGVVMAIVDPGVATERRAIAVEVAGGDGVLIGPDNGLLAPAVALAGGAERAVELTNPDHQLAAPGATFAGRDIFAPAAAHLCNGIELTDLGPLLDVELLMPGVVPLVQADEERVIAQVLWVDRFGNAQLNVAPDDLAQTFGERIEVRVEHPTAGAVARSARRVRAFAELGSGEVGLVLDSTGLLALVLDQRSAAEELELAPGDQVTLTPGSDDDGRGLTQPVGTPTRR